MMGSKNPSKNLFLMYSRKMRESNPNRIRKITFKAKAFSRHMVQIKVTSKIKQNKVILSHIKDQAPLPIQLKMLTQRIGKARAFKSQKIKFLKLIAKTVRNLKSTL